jgi:hypothetical protein
VPAAIEPIALPHTEQQQLCARVCNEFMEMPGLRLTLPQAARLFNLDRERCARVLDTLIDAGILSNIDGVFGFTESSRGCGSLLRRRTP